MICKYSILFLFIYPALHKLVVLSSSVVAGDNIYGYLFNITSSLITINWFILNILLLVSTVNNKMYNHNIVYSKYFNNITNPRCYYILLLLSDKNDDDGNQYMYWQFFSVVIVITTTIITIRIHTYKYNKQYYNSISNNGRRNKTRQQDHYAIVMS